MSEALEYGKVYTSLPELVYQVVRNNEGGYQCHPSDSGNYATLDGKKVLMGTNMGITPGTVVRAMRLGVIPNDVLSTDYMKNIAEVNVRKIYDLMYFRECRANQLPYPLSLLHFDTSLLHGLGNHSGGAGFFLQKVIRGNGIDIPIDGVVGPVTLNAFNECLKNPELDRDRDGTTLDDFCYDYLAVRMSSYLDIVQRNPSKAVFLSGWRRRVNSLRRYVENAQTA